MPPNTKKTIVKKIYALMIEFSNTSFLSVHYTYSLEDAFKMAKIEFWKQNPKLLTSVLTDSMLGARIGLFSIKTVAELTKTQEILPQIPENNHEKISQVFDSFLKEIKPGEIKQNSVVETGLKKVIIDKKNEVMKEIIKNKDRMMFESVKTSFTEAERKYIEEHLK